VEGAGRRRQRPCASSPGWAGEEGRRVGSGGEVLGGRQRHGGGWRRPPHGEHHLAVAGIHGVLRLSELNLGMMDLGDAEQVEI
jgi:hypothetical protein